MVYLFWIRAIVFIFYFIIFLLFDLKNKFMMKDHEFSLEICQIKTKLAVSFWNFKKNAAIEFSSVSVLTLYVSLIR